jgi:hypothetical protein
MIGISKVNLRHMTCDKVWVSHKSSRPWMSHVYGLAVLVKSRDYCCQEQLDDIMLFKSCDLDSCRKGR